MPKCKSHLTQLYRGVAHSGSRKGFLRLDMNESVEGLPDEFVRSVLDKMTGADLARYPEYGELTELIASSVDLEPANVLVTNGSDAGIKHLFEAYVGPGDKVLHTDPTFAMYPVYSMIHQGEQIAVPYNDDLSFPLESFMEALNENPKMAVVVNPNNPTGSRIDQEAIRSIAVACRERDILLSVDEAYFHYLEETAAGLVSEFDNVVVLRTFSKLGGLATLRIGYTLGHPSIIDALGKAKSSFEVNGMAVAMATALMKQPDVMKKQLRVVARGKEWLLCKLKEAKIDCVPGYANFVLVDCGDRAGELAEALKEDGVLVGAGFKQPFLAKYLRVTLAGVENMEKFWHVFERHQ